MKILWFTNIPLKEAQKYLGFEINGSGGWMDALLEELINEKKIEIIIASTYTGKKLLKFCGSDSKQIYYLFPETNRLSDNLKFCSDILLDSQPDIIHCHGTERFFGLVKSIASVPVVISIQGIINPYSKWYSFWGDYTFYDLMKILHPVEFFLSLGLWRDFKKMKQQAIQEKQIFEINDYYMGRTKWDLAHTLFYGYNKKYYKVGELIRRPFWEKRWRMSNIKEQSIMYINAGHPRKGFEVLLNAAKQLKKKYADISIIIAGNISTRNGYGKYIRKRIMKSGINTKLLGAVTAEKLSDEMLLSHVYVHPSFIDNSPNSVCEAQLLGVPVIASCVGGIPDLITNGQSGFLFPSGDSQMLAFLIDNIFSDRKLAESFSANSIKVASERHNSETVVRQLFMAYEDILSHA